jgi:hypothetical protein
MQVPALWATRFDRLQNPGGFHPVTNISMTNISAHSPFPKEAADPA